MKMITAKTQHTLDLLNSSSFTVKKYLKDEVLVRLRAEFEKKTQSSISPNHWDILVHSVVEIRTVKREGDIREITATMTIPEDSELFEEDSNV